MALIKDVVEINCKIKTETDKAILIWSEDTEGDRVQNWIPISQVHQIHKTAGDSDSLYPDKVVMNKWIAIKKELIEP